MVSVPLYQERYRFVTAAGGPYDGRKSVTWAETGQVPLCLLTPNMQNRRIIDQQIRAAGGESAATLESNSMIVLMSHVRTLRWASIMPAVLVNALGAIEGLQAIRSPPPMSFTQSASWRPGGNPRRPWSRPWFRSPGTWRRRWKPRPAHEKGRPEAALRSARGNALT